MTNRIVITINPKVIRANCNELSRIKKIRFLISRLDRLVRESV